MCLSCVTAIDTVTIGTAFRHCCCTLAVFSKGVT